MIFYTTSPEETHYTGATIASLLRPGDILAYTGGMGVGKTTFTAGLVKGLGLKDSHVSSPTFALVHQYGGGPKEPTLYHFDFYRLYNLEDLAITGFFDYLDGESILAIEWSEKLGDALPETHITVDFVATGEETRTITITGDERF